MFSCSNSMCVYVISCCFFCREPRARPVSTAAAEVAVSTSVADVAVAVKIKRENAKAGFYGVCDHSPTKYCLEVVGLPNIHISRALMDRGGNK